MTPSGLRGQLQSFVQEPQQRLPYRTEFAKLAKNKQDRFLDSTIRVFFQALVRRLQEAYWSRHHQFTAPRFGVACLDRAGSQQVQFVFVQVSLQPEQQPIVALPRGVHHLFVEQQCIDHPAHLDQLLPFPVIARSVIIHGRRRRRLSPSKPRPPSVRIPAVLLYRLPYSRGRHR